MNTANATYLTRQKAQQVAQEEVVLNAAYINGDWVAIDSLTTDSDNKNSHALYDPNSGEIIATTRLCTSAHVDAADEGRPGRASGENV